MKIINGKKDIMTIPNLLSLIRLILAALFLWVFYFSDISAKRESLIGILVLSALTDYLDGKIARKFHMVSELGKILDPIADKITQGVLLICLLSEYKLLTLLLILFVIKESYMAFEGIRVIKRTDLNEGAMWYGKVNTAVFYLVMFLLIFVPGISGKAANLLILISGIFMLLAFVMYAIRYHKLMQQTLEEDERWCDAG